MKPPPSFLLFLDCILVAYGVLILLGVKRRWRWLMDPPDWLFAVHFPSFVKRLYGRRFVIAVTLVLAWFAITLGVFGLIKDLVEIALEVR